MEVTFKGGDGNAPFFTYKNTKFLIMDFLELNKWMYYVAEKDLSVEFITFATHEKAIEYILNEFNFNKYSYKYSEKKELKYLYSDKYKDYIINKNTLTIKNRPIRLTLDYDNYYDCLKEAKRIAENHIKKIEPEQIKLY